MKATRTNWSTYDALNVYFDKSIVGHPPIAESSLSAKNWSDGWRYAIGLEHNLSDKYTVMAGFAFDESSIPSDGGDFIVPTGLRRTYSIGARYNDKKQTVAVALGWMDVGTLDLQVILRRAMLIRVLMLTTALPRLLLFPTNVNSNFIFCFYRSCCTKKCGSSFNMAAVCATIGLTRLLAKGEM